MRRGGQFGAVEGDRTHQGALAGLSAADGPPHHAGRAVKVRCRGCQPPRTYGTVRPTRSTMTAGSWRGKGANVAFCDVEAPGPASASWRAPPRRLHRTRAVS